MSRQRVVEKANNFGATLKRIIKLLFKKYTFSTVLVVVFALASTIFSIVGPKIMGRATTELFEGLVAKINNTGSINFEKIAGILLTVLGLYLLSALFMFIEGWLMSNISQNLTYDIRKDISKKINTLPMGYFEQRTVGETLSRVTNDVDTLGQSLNQSFTQIIANTTMVLGVLVMMFTISIFLVNKNLYLMLMVKLRKVMRVKILLLLSIIKIKVLKNLTLKMVSYMQHLGKQTFSLD